MASCREFIHSIFYIDIAKYIENGQIFEWLRYFQHFSELGCKFQTSARSSLEDSFTGLVFLHLGLQPIHLLLTCNAGIKSLARILPANLLIQSQMSVRMGKRLEINGIRNHQRLGDANDIFNEAIAHAYHCQPRHSFDMRRFTRGERLPDDDTEDFRLFLGGREWVIGQDPPLDSKEGGNCGLFNMGILLFEFIRETETDDGETRVVALRVIMIEFGVVIGTNFVDV